MLDSILCHLSQLISSSSPGSWTRPRLQQDEQSVQPGGHFPGYCSEIVQMLYYYKKLTDNSKCLPAAAAVGILTLHPRQ